MMKTWFILCTLTLAAASMFGCEAHTRYRVLCVLFDGVPTPKGEIPCNGSPPAPGSVQAAEGKAENASAGGYIQHGPYAAKLCEGCHQRQTNKLLLDTGDLCLYCHVLSTMKKHVHGPVASGGCIVCHDPHGSGNKYLLVSKTQDFCLYCHKRENIFERSIHAGIDDMNCTQCHDAHASNNEYLLRESPDSNDDSSPWVNPQQKKLDKKYAKTAKASAGQSSPDKNKVENAKQKNENELNGRPNVRTKSNGKAKRTSGSSPQKDAWTGLISF